MLTIDRKLFLIHAIYEHGMDFNEAIFELTGNRGHATNRIVARDLIIDFLSSLDYIKGFDLKKHPIFDIIGPDVNRLVDLLTTLAKGGKSTMPKSEGPHLF